VHDLLWQHYSNLITVLRSNQNLKENSYTAVGIHMAALFLKTYFSFV